jgi:chromosome segregation ATPase
MDQRKTLIRDFEKEIETKQRSIQDLLYKTGQYLFENYKKDTRLKAQDDYDAAKKLGEQIDEYSSVKKRIGEIENRLSDIKEEIGEVGTEIENIERTNSPLYEKLGEAAFLRFKKDPQEFSGYRDVFAQIEDQSDEIGAIERDIDKLQEPERDRKFFEKIADKGQLAYLKGVRMVRSKTLPKLYAQTGRELVKTDFLDTTTDEDLLKIADPFLKNRSKLQNLEDRRNRLGAEEEELHTELQQLGVDKRADRRIEELDRNIEAAEEKLRSRLTNIGTAVRSDTPSSIADDSSYKDFISSITENEKKIENYRQNIAKLEAAIEADNLARQIERMKETIEDHKRRIEESKREIGNLEKRIEEAEQEKTKQEEIRGPEEITLQS